MELALFSIDYSEKFYKYSAVKQNLKHPQNIAKSLYVCRMFFFHCTSGLALMLLESNY